MFIGAESDYQIFLTHFLSSMSHPCQAKCGRYFTSIKSMNLHLTSARSCSWYAEQGLRDLGVNDVEDGEPLSASDLQDKQNVEDQEWQDYDPQEDPDVAMEFGPYGDELQFLPDEAVNILDENQPQAPEDNVYLETTHSRALFLMMVMMKEL